MCTGAASPEVVTVDPNVRNKLIWRGVTAVKPNRIEAFAAANQPWREAGPDPLKDELLLHVGNGLLEISNHASSVVVAKLGTATLTPDELLKSFRLNNGEVAHIVPKDPLCVAEPSVTLTSPPKILGLRNRSHRPIKKGYYKLRRHTKKVFASAGIA